MINSSPDRFTFQANKYKEQLAEEPDNKVALALIDYFDKVKEEATENLQSEEWKRDNLEYDLRSTAWICDKVKASRSYAQNLYASMCNREFVKNEVWPRLKDHRWSCSWRYAGGIVSDMLEVGDYIDWYCSGIRNPTVDDELFTQMSKEEQYCYLESTKYVDEGCVTDEINDDLLKLGWLVVGDIDYD